MQLYNQILLTAFISPCVPKEVLTAGSRSLRFAQETIRSAIENGHLNERIVTSKNGSQKMTEHFLTTTPSGIRFLIENDSGKSWLSCIDVRDTKHAVSNPYSYTGKRVIRRMAKYAEARTFSVLSGACSELLPGNVRNTDVVETGNGSPETTGDPKDRPKSGKTYIDLIRNAVSVYEARELNERIPGITAENLPEDFIRFTGINTLRELRRIDGKEDNEHGPGTADGIIDSRRKSLLIYSNFDVGVNGDPWLYKSDLDMLAVWNQNRPVAENGDGFHTGGNDAVLLVKNRRHFEQLYRDTAGLRNGKRLGNGFDRYYIVPKTYEGTLFLRHLMLTDSEGYERRIIDGLTGMMGMHCYSGIADGIFPLTDGLKLYAIGTDMDAVRMSHISRFASVYPDTKFGIICCRWQTEYYRSIFGEVETIEISTDE